MELNPSEFSYFKKELQDLRQKNTLDPNATT
jgi:hypothetical protein